MLLGAGFDLKGECARRRGCEHVLLAEAITEVVRRSVNYDAQAYPRLHRVGLRCGIERGLVRLHCVRDGFLLRDVPGTREVNGSLYTVSLYAIVDTPQAMIEPRFMMMPHIQFAYSSVGCCLA